MCFVTLPIAAIALSAVGTAATVYGAISGGEAAAAQAEQQAQMSRYQAQVARNNQIIANQQADAEVQAGVRAAEMKSLETASRVARVRAGLAANGVDVSGDSAVDVQASERAVGKIDTETALSNYQIRAYGYRSKAVGYGAQGGLYDASASGYASAAGDARTAGYLKAGGTLLSAASSLPLKFGGGTTGSMGGNFPSDGNSWNAGPI